MTTLKCHYCTGRTLNNIPETSFARFRAGLRSRDSGNQSIDEVGVKISSDLKLTTHLGQEFYGQSREYTGVTRVT